MWIRSRKTSRKRGTLLRCQGSSWPPQSRRTAGASCRPTRRRPPSAAAVQQLPDSPAGVVTDVERPIGPDRQPRRAVAGPRGLLLWPGESIGEDLVVSRGLAGRERLEDDVEPRLRLRRTVPGSVEGDECAAAILLRELRPAVKHQVVRR